MYIPLLVVPITLIAASAVLVTRGEGEPEAAQQYEVHTTVLESPGHGPELCLGGVASSLPPQCGGPPLVGWDWTLVDDEESRSGTTWTSAHVVGTYDGERFTLTQPPGPFEEQESHPVPGPACDEQKATNDDGVEEWEESVNVGDMPDVIAVWVNDSRSATWDGPFVGNFIVRPGDAERAEAAVREHWGGHLCVVERDQPSPEELDDIMQRMPEVLSNDLLMVDADHVRGVVVVEVVVVTDEVREKVRDAFDERLVELTGALKPI